jgi:isopentenyl-diphosphate delta-isomerase
MTAMTAINVILVDENDAPVGTMEKLQAHEKGLKHRAILVYVLNGENKLLLQRRAASKYHCGGLWSNTCCGHPYPNESVQQAAQRRLHEEMGLLTRLDKILEFSYETALPNGMIENEYGHVFMGCTDRAPVLNPDEADGYQYLSLDAIDAALAAHPESFTPWFRLCFGKFKVFQSKFKVLQSMQDMPAIATPICDEPARSEPLAGSNTVPHLALLLDRCVILGHRLRFSGRPYPPWLFFSFMADAVIVALSLFWAARHPDVRPAAAFAMAYILAQASYFGVRRLREGLGKSASRSFLQDTLLLFLPLNVLYARALGLPLQDTLEAIGLALPIGMIFIRIGCFLGGCCYGKPFRLGVRYPPELMQPHLGCPRYSPGPIPDSRVLPTQLLEALLNFILAVTLCAWVAERGNALASGSVLMAYFFLYSIGRIVIDFWRIASARPRLGPFSEAQCLAAFLACASGGTLLWQYLR